MFCFEKEKSRRNWAKVLLMWRQEAGLCSKCAFNQLNDLLWCECSIPCMCSVIWKSESQVWKVKRLESLASPLLTSPVPNHLTSCCSIFQNQILTRGLLSTQTAQFNLKSIKNLSLVLNVKINIFKLCWLPLISTVMYHFKPAVYLFFSLRTLCFSSL